MKKFVKSTPILKALALRLRRMIPRDSEFFPGSEEYWKKRYDEGGDSGAGSYNKLAEFKAEVVNSFVESNSIRTVIEYGSGDGNQLKLAIYPSYIGFDVSPKAIEVCRHKFADDCGKVFRLMNEYSGETAELTLSLDVIYHLTEDEVYEAYMKRLFESSEKFVIIYSSDHEEEQRNHERRRKFSDWVIKNVPQWKLLQHIPNRYPWNGVNEDSSLASFYIYQKT